MRFPYQRSVGNDLRELFKYERLRTGAEPLGQSSIDEGSGSLEVRDGAGGAVAAIGDLPGGRLGIGILWGGSLTDLADLLRDIADRLEVVEEMGPGDGSGNNDVWDSRQDRDLAGLRRRASNNEAADTLQGQRIGRLGDQADGTDRDVRGLERRVQELERALAEAANELGRLGRDVEQGKRGLDEHAGELSKHRGEIEKTTQHGDILEVWHDEAEARRHEDKSAIERALEWLDGLYGDGGELQSLADTAWRNQAEVTQARGGQANLKTRVNGVASTAASAASTAAAAASAAAGAQSTAESAASAAATAQSTASSAASAASAAQTSATQANDRITDARGSYGSLTSRLNAMTSDISDAASGGSGAAATANAVQSEVVGARSGYGSLNGRLNAMNTADSQLQSAINTIVSAVNNLRSRVAALDGGPGGPINP